MSEVYFIGDLHAGHKNICKFRQGFESEEHHFEHMKKVYHDVVTKRDRVFFMGDTAFTKERLLDIATCTVTEEEYKSLKGTQPSPITSWIRFVCSVGGKFENGYARDKTERNYAQEGKSNALKQSPKIQTSEFLCCSYQDLTENITNSLIYCDPPYQGTTGYKTGQFNHEEFFNWCRLMKFKGNIVFVSEYNAPEDFEVVWQGEIKTNFSSTRKSATHNAVEKLFKV